MVRVNSQYPQDLRLPTLQDEAKLPKNNPQPLDQYQDTAPIFGDFEKFSGAQTGNAILTNRIQLDNEFIGKGTEKDPSETPTPSAPAKPDPCAPTETKVKVKIGPLLVEVDHSKACPAPAPHDPKPAQ